LVARPADRIRQLPARDSLADPCCFITSGGFWRTAMWIRKRLDIDWPSLLLAAGQALWPNSERASEERLQSQFGKNTITCLSVRSAWDLLLQALALPAGSEVLMSAITVPDMAAIARHHQLQVVPIDLDPETAAPCLNSLRRAASP